MAGKDIKVSICCLVYNQAQYVEDMLQGIFMQKVDFDYEVIIHDDASTDGTIEILKKYKERYPDIIELLLEEENQYSKGVIISKNILYPCVRGKYMILLEGDDYWIYEGKLQAQYDLMEAHPEVSLCYHNALVHDMDRDEMHLCIYKQKSGYISDSDIICANHGWYPTASLFCRSAYLIGQPDLLSATGDEGIRTYMACRGQVYFIDRVWSVYRQFIEGSFNDRYRKDIGLARNYNKKLIRYFLDFNEYSGKRFEKYIYDRVKDSLVEYIRVHHNINCTMEQFQIYVEELKDTTGHIADDLLDLFHDIEAIRCTDYFQTIIKQKIIGQISPHSKLYLYGAGREALKAVVMLLKENIQISGFILTLKSPRFKQLLEYPVYEIEDIEMDKDVVIWPCMLNGRKGVITLLQEKKCPNIIL